MQDDIINFDIEGNTSSIIKIIGVGGGGGNAVNYMYKQGITDVEFVICNTDAQALNNSPVSKKIHLGASISQGRGAGNKPAVGRESAIESLPEITTILEDNTKMVFITAGMGGGTGTGAAPVIAEAARELGILTVGIVTIPFKFEGPLRIKQALEGIREIEKHVDSLLIINNERLREMYGNLKMKEAFAKADDVLKTAAKGIAEIITVDGYINVDFADVETVMRNSGVAVMGSGVGKGEYRAIDAIELALESPLLNSNNIRGSKNILLNITYGEADITMDEISTITGHIEHIIGNSSTIIWGTGMQPHLEDDEVSVTIIATGFASGNLGVGQQKEEKPEKKIKHRYEIDAEGNITEEEEFEPEVQSEKDHINFTLKERQDETTDSGITDEDIKRLYDSTPRQVEPTIEIDSTNYNEKYETSEQNEIDVEELQDEQVIRKMENEPAYKRRGRKIESEEGESPEEEGGISRFTITRKRDDDIDLDSRNSFLYDNVD